MKLFYIKGLYLVQPVAVVATYSLGVRCTVCLGRAREAVGFMVEQRTGGSKHSFVGAFLFPTDVLVMSWLISTQ
jgi:hypothetical protein